MEMQAGKYAIGDPCYLFNDETWLRICQLLEDLPGGRLEINGHVMWCFNTAFGDGTYFDNFDNVYPVDSGLIGVVPCELIEVDEHPNQIANFPHDFTVRCALGRFSIGGIEIDTMGELEVDDDSWDY